MILVDLNVLLDVVQRREPHYPASAAVLDRVIRGDVRAVLLTHFGIASVGRVEVVRARTLGWADFEDAVVAAAAESSDCELIVTRNVRDFGGSPLPALTPEEYLLGFDTPA